MPELLFPFNFFPQQSQGAPFHPRNLHLGQAQFACGLPLAHTFLIAQVNQLFFRIGKGGKGLQQVLLPFRFFKAFFDEGDSLPGGEALLIRLIQGGNAAGLLGGTQDG